MALSIPRACVRWGIIMATGAALCVSPRIAAAQDTRANRQGGIDHILTTASSKGAARIRSNCASGDMPALLARSRKAGLFGLPDVADYCVATLIRLGRDGALSFLSDTRSDQPTPALAFDTGFVTAFRKKEPVTPDLPSMIALKPLAERCLAQSEPSIALCAAAGQVFGTRAAHGEVVVAQ